MTLDGDVTTGLIGFHAEWERALAGIMLSQSTGEGAYPTTGIGSRCSAICRDTAKLSTER